MTEKTILIAGEPLELLNRAVPSIEVYPLCGTLMRFSIPTDSEQGAAWHRAIERYAADLINTVQPLTFEQRKDAAFVRIARELAAANRQET